jgi:hypothetical protein
LKRDWSYISGYGVSRLKFFQEKVFLENSSADNNKKVTDGYHASYCWFWKSG